jgi:DNA-binding CsgD family transcriptional regulator
VSTGASAPAGLTLAATRAHRAWLAAQRASAPAAVCAATAAEALRGDALLQTAGQHSAYHLGIGVLIMTDAVGDASRAVAALREHGGPPMRACTEWYEAELALRVGELRRAERHARDALDASGESAGFVVAGALRVLVCALAERGAFDEAHELLRSTPAPASTGLGHARARLSLAEGGFEDAYAAACEVGRRREREGRTNPASEGWRSTAAIALAHLGRTAEATALSDAELAAANAFGAPLPIARAATARAIAEPDLRVRAALCADGVARFSGRRTGLELTRLRLELGSALYRIGRRVQAREALLPALAEADRAGAVLLAQRARRELVATGLRPRRAALAGAGALTPRQHQICELAARGKGNRAIATELFLSIKTVETHLASAYRKLGVTARGELAATLGAPA